MNKATPTKSKEAAGYKDTAPTRHCRACSMFRAPASCTLVRGRIAPGGTCRFWEAKRGT